MPNFHRVMALGLVAVAWLAAVPLHAQITQAVDDVVVLKSQDMTGIDNSGTYYDPKPIIDTEPVLARSHSVYLFVHGGLWYPAAPPGAYPGYACADGDQIELFVSDPGQITTPIKQQPLNSNTVMRTTPCSTDPAVDNRDSKGQKLAFANAGQAGTGTSWTHSNGVKLEGKKLMLFERSSNSGILQIPYEHRLYLFVSTTWRNPNGKWNVGKYQAVKVPASLHQTGLKLGNSAMTPIPIRTWTNIATGDKSHTFGVFFRMNRPGGVGSLDTGYLELEYSPDLYGTVDPIRVSVLDQSGNMTALPADGTLNFVPGDVFEELNVNPPSHIPAQVYLNGGRIYLLAMVHKSQGDMNYPCANPPPLYFNNRGFSGANLRTYRLLFNPLRFVASRDMVSIYRTVTQQLPADYQVSNWFGQRVDWGGFQYLYLAHRDDDICTQALFSIFADIKIWVARVTEPVF